jgi:hypothetical protein
MGSTGHRGTGEDEANGGSLQKREESFPVDKIAQKKYKPIIPSA